MWEYSDNEYVKLFRKMLRWEWYTDISTKVLFIHCLLKANWRDTKWRGMDIKRGQFVTSLSSLSKETGLSVQQVRTALEHLQVTGELTSKTYAKFRVLTVNFYTDYQSANKVSNKQTTSRATSNQQATNKQATTDIRIYKNIQEDKEDKKSASPDSYNPWEDEITDAEIEEWSNT